MTVWNKPERLMAPFLRLEKLVCYRAEQVIFTYENGVWFAPDMMESGEAQGALTAQCKHGNEA